MSTRKADLATVLADLLGSVEGAESSAKPALAREIRLLHAELEALEKAEPVGGSVFDELSGWREKKTRRAPAGGEKRRVAAGGKSRAPKG